MMATIFALSLVPAGAQATPDQGRMDSTENYGGKPLNQGTITIKGSQDDETYDVYRIFDLASFSDADTTAGEHADDSEAYSYVISESSDWWGFFNPNKSGGNDYTVYKEGSNAAGNKLFWVEPGKLTLTGPDGVKSDYHVVTATTYFSNAWDVAEADAELDAGSSDTDTSHGTFDYVTTDYANASGDKASIKVVQDFAQQALAWAKTNISAPNYRETGTGSDLVVNGANTLNAGTNHSAPAEGKVYLGWYLVGTTMGTLASLDTTNREVTIYEKNQAPQLAKKVLKNGADAGEKLTSGQSPAFDENATGADLATGADWVAGTDADQGDYVQFKTVITAQQGARDYRLHDVMEPGLNYLGLTQNINAATVSSHIYGDGLISTTSGTTTTYDYSTKVYLVRQYTESEETKYHTYRIPATTTKTISQNTSKNITNWVHKGAQTDGCDFEIEFKDATPEDDADLKDNKVVFYDDIGDPIDVRDGDKIVVTYWAELDKTGKTKVYGRDDVVGTDDYSDVKDNAASTEWSDPADASINSPGQVHKTSDGNQRNTNSTILTYGNDSHTEWRSAEVATHDFDIVKTTQKSDGLQHLLAGAKFSLYKATTDHTKQYSETDSSGDAPVTTYGIAYKPSDGTLNNDHPNSSTSDVYYQASKAMKFTASGSEYSYDGDEVTKTGPGTQLVSADGAEIRVYGLDKGYYLLVEDEAPAGYNKLAYPIVVEIAGDSNFDGLNTGTGNADDGRIKVYARSNSNDYTSPSEFAGQDAIISSGNTANNELSGAVYRIPAVPADNTDPEHPVAAQANGGVDVVNNTGAELPSTGGIGTTVFYVAGGVLVVGAVVMLVAKRRMGAEA